MNKVYRLIASRVSGVVQVAPETARTRGKGKSLARSGALAALLSCATPMAWGDTYWNVPAGDWFTAGNWDTNAVPTPSDNAYIDNAGTAQVQTAGAQALSLYTGANGSGTLDISNGGTVSNLSSYVGFSAGSSGAVTVDGTGSSWTSLFSLDVGYAGSGTLALTNGGTVKVAAGGGSVMLAGGAGSSGTLNIGNGGAAGILNAARVTGGSGTATLNFNHTNSAYYFTNDGTSSGAAIIISGSTTVNQNGSGTTILTGNNDYFGDTNINAGTLLVNGSITSNTFVNSGGTLGGSGSLGNVTVNSGGTLSPGNSPGILTVNGNLTLNSGATTVMQIDGATLGTQYDHIDVVGIAMLNGTLDLRFSYAPPGGSTYNLMNAGNIVLTGDPVKGFNPIIISSNLGAALKATPVISPHEYDILIEQLSFQLASGSSLTPNQASVATALDSLAASGRGATLIGVLDMLPAGALPGAFNPLSGVQYTHTLSQVARVSRQFMHILDDRLSWSDYTSNTTASRFNNVQLAYSGDNVASLFGTPVAASSGNLWLRAMGGSGAIDSDGNAPGADYNSSGVALGYDREVRDGLLAGVAFGFTRSNVDVNAGGADIDSYQLAAYGRQQSEDNYLDATLGIGHHRTDSTRLVQFTGFSGVAQADYSTDGVGLSLEAGKHYALSATSRMTPFAGLEYGHYRQQSFHEAGAGDANLAFDNDSMDSLRSVLGARMNNTLTASTGAQIYTTLGLSWAHEFLGREAVLNPAFAVNGNVPFRIKGPVTNRDHLLATLGVSARLSKMAQLDLDYNGEFAESDHQHALSATFRLNW